MLLRLNRLQGITRWNTDKGANFLSTTVIYAENGRGKTSFAAMLRSLSASDPALLLERATIGAKTPPSVELLVDAGHGLETRLFNGAQWNASLPDFEYL